MEPEHKPKYYVLNEDHTVRVTYDIFEYLHFREKRLRVKLEQIGRYDISTAFLGTNHNFFGEPPLLFETMIFYDGEAVVDDECEYQERCSTWNEAISMHEKAVQYVKRLIGPSTK